MLAEMTGANEKYTTKRYITETEMLTSTLHHNIFTYLDNVFSATFILSDFIHIYFHIYEGHLLINVNFAKGVGSKKLCLQGNQ